MTRQARSLVRSDALAALCLFVLLFGTAGTRAQAPPKRLSKADVIALLSNDVTPTRVMNLLEQRGCDFVVTNEGERDIRHLMASKGVATAQRDAFVDTLRRACPKMSASPAEGAPATRGPTPVVAPKQAPAASALRGVQIRPNKAVGSYFDVVVTAVAAESPAAIAGLRVHDEIGAVVLAGDVVPGRRATREGQALVVHYPASAEEATEDFSYRARACVPDCVVTVIYPTRRPNTHCWSRSKPDSNRAPCLVEVGGYVVAVDDTDGGPRNLAVGTLGTNFVQVYSVEASQYVFEDRRTSHQIPTMWFQFDLMRANLSEMFNRTTPE